MDAGSFLVSSACLALIRGSFNAAAPAGRPAGSAIRALLADVREGLAYVWSNPVLRSISIMMALINFVAATADSQLVLFARRALLATNSEIGFLYAAGAAGIVAVSLVAGPIRERLSFAVTALGALVLTGLTMTAMALAGSYPAALVLWAASSGFGMLFNINTVALRQAIVPPRLYGRVVSVAQVLAWSAMPLGSLAGAAAINLSGSVTGVYAVIGGLIAAIALAFAFSPVAHGDRYLAEAAERPGLQAGGELGHDVRRRLRLPARARRPVRPTSRALRCRRWSRPSAALARSGRSPRRRRSARSRRPFLAAARAGGGPRLPTRWPWSCAARGAENRATRPRTGSGTAADRSRPRRSARRR